MAGDIEIRDPAQADADAQRLSSTAAEMRSALQSLRSKTQGILQEQSGDAITAYWQLFDQYSKGFEEQCQVREDLARRVREAIARTVTADGEAAKFFPVH